MPRVYDIAKHILENFGPMTAMKLQKLVYYSQAWSLVWDEAPLFDEQIQAWANGPVSPDLYKAHRGEFMMTKADWGYSEDLTYTQRETIQNVIKFYGPLSSQQLSDLTHSEKPWCEARKGLTDGERGDREITHASMHEFYSSL